MVIDHNGTEKRAIQVYLGSSSEFWTMQRDCDPDLKNKFYKFKACGVFSPLCLCTQGLWPLGAFKSNLLKVPANSVPAAAGIQMEQASCYMIRSIA